MNINHELYKDYTNMKWVLDDWSIPKECFDKIVEILPFGSKILELGSGKATDVMGQFYEMISIETDELWLDKYNSTYLHVPFDEDYKWYDVNILKQKLENQTYDLFLIDGPKGFRSKIINHLELFNNDVPWIFDDTMAEEHFNTMKTCAEKLNMEYETYQCKVNPKAVYWKQGKKYSLLF